MVACSSPALGCMIDFFIFIYLFTQKNPDDPQIQSKLDSSQSTAYHLQGLMSQRSLDLDAEQQQQQQQSATSQQQQPTTSQQQQPTASQQQQQLQPTSSSTNFRDLKAQQVLAQASKDEADLQRETEVLIQNMHEQASREEIPEFGKRIIEVLQNYQGKYNLCPLCYTIY